MAVDAAVSLIEQEASKALDPRAVEAFLRVLPRVGGSRGVRARHGGRRESPAQGDSVRRHCSRPWRDLRALSDRADDGDEPWRYGLDGTHRVQADDAGSVLRLHAVPLRSGRGRAPSPIRHRDRLRADATVDAQERSGAAGMGGSQSAFAVECARPISDLEAAGLSPPTAARSALVCALVFEARVIGTSRFITRRRVSIRKIIAGCSTACANRSRGHQRHRARADARGVAHRSIDGPAQHALHGDAPERRARPCRGEYGGVAARHRSR